MSLKVDDFTELARIGDVSFHRCEFSSLADEGQHLFALHWVEANNDFTTPLDVDWEAFRRLELIGLEVCVAVRSAGRLIGYAVYLLHPALHYRGLLVAEADAFFVDHPERRGWVGIRLFQLAEQLLRERGVGLMQTRVKDRVQEGRVGELMHYLGHHRVETTWRKALR